MLPLDFKELAPAAAAPAARVQKRNMSSMMKDPLSAMMRFISTLKSPLAAVPGRVDTSRTTRRFDASQPQTKILPRLDSIAS